MAHNVLYTSPRPPRSFPSSSTWLEEICGKQSRLCKPDNDYTELKTLLHPSAKIQVCFSRSLNSYFFFKIFAVVFSPVHEIAGVVPTSVIHSLMKAMFVDPTSGGIDTEGIAANTRQPGNAYKRVNEAVKHVGRQGYSAGQVLIQVSLDRSPLVCFVGLLMVG